MRFVRASGVGGGGGWRFDAVGDVSREISGHPSFTAAVRRLGVVDDLVAELCDASAVAVLSDYGRGFKTKILDAILCGCWVLASPRLVARLPDEVRPFCIAVDPTDDAAARDALARSLVPPPTGTPNSSLRTQAFEALDRFFFGRPAAP